MSNLELVKQMGENLNLQKRIENVLGENKSSFITSVINTVADSDALAKCDPSSVWGSAMIAAAMKLPVDKNLGYAYIVPYKGVAQFQMGYKGFIQLALRTGEYEHIHITEVYADELKKWNPLLGLILFNEDCEFKDRTSEKEPVGFYSMFKLKNGFSANVYMTKDEMERHASEYSQSYKSDLRYKKKSSLWSKDFVKMGKKTVIKQLLSVYGILSVEIQSAMQYDQASVDIEGKTKYIDNDPEIIDIGIKKTDEKQEKKEVPQEAPQSEETPAFAGN